MKQITIGIPSNGYTRTETVHDLIAMMGTTIGVSVNTVFPMCCYVHLNREQCAMFAVSHKSDYLLFIDTDMQFPPNTLTQLLSHDKDIVGVQYHKRSLPKMSVVEVDDTFPVSKEELYKCKATGMGVMLIKTEVFNRLPRPWFYFDPMGYRGEDYYFCDSARKHGYDIWIDPKLTIGHIGNIVF